MNKKIYNTPTVNVVTIKMSTLMAGSIQYTNGPAGLTVGDETTTEEGPIVTESRGSSFWDD